MRIFSTSPIRQLVLLAPAAFIAEPAFGTVESNPNRYAKLLGNMQRFRGRVYVGDGAISATDLCRDGRHRQGMDQDSWHVLSVDARDRVYGCARYRPYEHPVQFGQLGVSRSEIASSERWGTVLRNAVQREIAAASRRQMSFVEVGGWALSEELRCSTEALRIALSMYALADLMGGTIGLTTATVRHASSSILRKIGGTPLTVEDCELPRYYDTRYNCDMEILRFDSSAPNSRYAEWINRMTAELSVVHVITAGDQMAAAAAVDAEAAHAPVFHMVPQYS